jgi:hypothetical protein
VYVGENVSDFTQPTRSSAGYVDQSLLSCSRVRCSLARQLVNLSLAVTLIANEDAPRQLAVTSQLGTLLDTAARVLRAEASVGQNEMPSAETDAMAIINRRPATIGWHGWMKAAGGFMGLPRELRTRHNMRTDINRFGRIARTERRNSASVDYKTARPFRDMAQEARC